MNLLAPTIPEDACGTGGTLYHALVVNGFGDVQWCGTFQDVKDAADCVDDYARTHKTMGWVSPTIYMVDARPSD